MSHGYPERALFLRHNGNGTSINIGAASVSRLNHAMPSPALTMASNVAARSAVNAISIPRLARVDLPRCCGKDPAKEPDSANEDRKRELCRPIALHWLAGCRIASGIRQ